MKPLDDTILHEVELLSKTIEGNNIVFWLDENIGEYGENWIHKVGWPTTIFFFKNIEDATAFKLCWG